MVELIRIHKRPVDSSANSAACPKHNCNAPSRMQGWLIYGLMFIH
jgi:hypothetical protein